MTRPRRPRANERWGLETRCLLVFVPLACLALNLLLPRLPDQPRGLMTTLDYSAAWLRHPVQPAANEDSWRPMRIAQAWLSTADAGPLYQEVFFERGVKLQYPPTSILWLDGLSAIAGPRGVSNAVLNGLSWLAVLVTVLLSGRLLSLRAGGSPDLPDRLVRGGLVLVAGLCFYPLVRGFQLGQIQTWIDALVAALLLAWVVGRPATSGALTGLACLIKPQLGLLLLWGLLRGHRRFVFGWAFVAVGLGTLSLAIYGLADHLDYLRVLSYIGSHGESFHPNQSVNGLAHRLLGNGNNLWWVEAFPPFDARVQAATLLSSIALVGTALLWRARDARGEAADTALDLSLVIVSVTLASPVAWTHHYGVLLPVFALALPACLAERARSSVALALLATAFLLVANTYRVANRLADTPLNFVQSYVFFGGLVLIGLLYWLRATAGRRA